VKKAIVIILALALSIGTASFAMAGDDASVITPPGKINRQFTERPQLQMTEEQKARMISLRTEMLELRKQVIQQNAANGTITQDQADKMTKRIDARLEAVKSGEIGPVCGDINFRGGKAPRGMFKNRGQGQNSLYQ